MKPQPSWSLKKKNLKDVTFLSGNSIIYFFWFRFRSKWKVTLFFRIIYFQDMFILLLRFSLKSVMESFFVLLPYHNKKSIWSTWWSNPADKTQRKDFLKAILSIRCEWIMLIMSLSWYWSFRNISGSSTWLSVVSSQRKTPGNVTGKFQGN